MQARQLLQTAATIKAGRSRYPFLVDSRWQQLSDMSLVNYLLPYQLALLAYLAAQYLLEQVVLTFDTYIYYVINGLMIILALTEVMMDVLNKLFYNYEIVLNFFRHQMYNNIN